ncbi:IS66 family transposase [Vallitalea pronyensis]|uniref:IS66 family transposase n=1 Tax=Vallitalea pronyensis TaxID=1348613 RepID=A0A8J8MI39_9FIRM|nr:IS66 family transposase [Vallitalea pronyensis]QUI22055.1 IS66 family transposase [Vallitalea pronyensis]
MWVYATGHTDEGICLYDYRTTRAGKHAKNFLHGFNGYLHTDGYAGYNVVPNIKLVGCLAHVRRKYSQALTAIKDVESTSHTKAKEGLQYCNQLFALEKKWKALSPEDRHEKRQEEMEPILDAFFAWAKNMKKVALSKSALGSAIQYTINQWPKVITILADGRLEISNNRAERMVKPFVINRKNFLFCNTAKGAQASAIVQSIVETAKANKIKPLAYLTYLFEQLPNIDVNNSEELNTLLPWSESIPQNCKTE